MVNARSGLDEETLRAIAQMTGGQYFRARDTRQLMRIYDTIDQLEPVEDEARSLRPVEEWFYWPLGLGVLLSMGLLLRRTG